MSAGGLIEDGAWVQRQLEQGASVTGLAELAGVTRQTASTWIRRHGLAAPGASAHRPSRSRLAALYHRYGTAAAVGKELNVTKATAHRWLVEAGVQMAPEGARGRGRPSDTELRRLYHERGTQKAVAESLGRDPADRATLARRAAPHRTRNLITSRARSVAVPQWRPPSRDGAS